MKDLKKIKDKVTSIWSYTELEMGDFSKAGLKKHIEKISSIVNDVLVDLDQVTVCTVCNYDVCNTCSDEMEKQMEKLDDDIRFK